MDESRLITDWQRERETISGFLEDPLQWVADGFDKVYQNMSDTFKNNKSGMDLATLIDILHFINERRYLILKE